MKIENIVVGPLQSNCYIVYDEKGADAIIIDPGDDPDKIEKLIKNNSLKVAYIICTHGHFDHIGAVSSIKRKTGGAVALHEDELQIFSRGKEAGAAWGFRIQQPSPPDMLLKEGIELTAGAVKLKVLHTPGHSPGGICLLGEKIIFTGDTIFAGSVGRTDFYGGDIEKLKLSFKRILSLPDETKIFPGHGSWTTVGDEKDQNFFVHEL